MDSVQRFPSLFFRQRLNAVGIPFLASVLLLCLFSLNWSAALLALFSLVLTVFAVFFRDSEGKKTIFCVAAGIALALAVFGYHELAHQRAAGLVGAEWEAEGVVVAVSEEGYDLSCKRVNGSSFSGKIRVRSDSLPKMGERVRGFLFGTDEVENEDRQDGILATAREICHNTVGQDVLYSSLGSLREHLSAFWGESREGGFLRAILLGDRSALFSSDVEAFRATASTHVLAISGLHVSQMIGFFFCLTRFLPISRRKINWIFFPVILFLVLLTGEAVSVMRAGLMSAFAVLAAMLRRRSDSVTALVLAAVLIVMAEPYAITGFSFAFSFSSTFAIVFAATPLCEEIRNRFSPPKSRFYAFWMQKVFLPSTESLLVALCVFVFTCPLQVILLDSVQPLMPLYSLLLIPLFAPCILIGVIWAGLSFLPFSPGGVTQVLSGLVRCYLELVSILAEGAKDPVSLGEAAPVVAFCTALMTAAMILKKSPVRWIVWLYLFLMAFFGLSPILFP